MGHPGGRPSSARPPLARGPARCEPLLLPRRARGRDSRSHGRVRRRHASTPLPGRAPPEARPGDRGGAQMSLRSQIRDAVDDVAPAPLDIERKVSSYVRANNAERKALRARRQRSPWAYRFQGAAALLAAALVVAVIAGLVFGGRFWRDLNSTPSTINQTELKSLESRPPSLPTVAAEAACPVTPS